MNIKIKRIRKILATVEETIEIPEFTAGEIWESADTSLKENIILGYLNSFQDHEDYEYVVDVETKELKILHEVVTNLIENG
jgi:hypothetical protein